MLWCSENIFRFLIQPTAAALFLPGFALIGQFKHKPFRWTYREAQHTVTHGGLRFKKKADESGAFRAMRNSPQGLLLHNLLLWHHLKQQSDFVTSFIGWKRQKSIMCPLQAVMFCNMPDTSAAETHVMRKSMILLSKDRITGQNYVRQDMQNYTDGWQTKKEGKRRKKMFCFHIQSYSVHIVKVILCI